MAEKLRPVEVLYCDVCSLPAEYCEFGPDFEKCKPWLIKNAPELYPDLVKEEADKTVEQLEGLEILGRPSKGGGSTSELRSDEEVKTLPGGKVKKKEKPEVVVEKIVRNKRKSVTIVKGLDMFGIKLTDASKKFGKKFASGASVVKGPTEKEQIDVQGDFMYEIVDFIAESWKNVSGFFGSSSLIFSWLNLASGLVPGSSIFVLEDGKKVSAF